MVPARCHIFPNVALNEVPFTVVLMSLSILFSSLSPLSTLLSALLLPIRLLPVSPYTGSSFVQAAKPLTAKSRNAASENLIICLFTGRLCYFRYFL